MGPGHKMAVILKKMKSRLIGGNNVNLIFLIFLMLSLPLCTVSAEEINPSKRIRIKAIGIPLADHYAGIVAFEKYKDQMEYADYQLMLLPGPELVAAYFRSEPDADIAFNVCPMVMDMFAKKQNFKWVSLIHRDGNALTINNLMNEKIKLHHDKSQRKPDARVADALSEFKTEANEPVICAVPSPLATHTTILYKYLRDHGKTFGFIDQDNVDVVLTTIKPPQSAAFLRRKTTRKLPAMFEQSLPWPEEAESMAHGHIAWYSKDVMNNPKGHVECIIIAKNEVIKKKRKALKEVIYYIHKAGRDIEAARKEGGPAMDAIIEMVQRQIPQHNRRAIMETLRPDLMAINYINLNVDTESKESFRKIMELAFEAGFVEKKINIEALADENFSTQITVE